MISEQEAKKYIYSIDFSQMLTNMENFEGWLREDALETCQQYRNFLFLKKKYSNIKFVPSEDIDEFWHNHILDTNKYAQDCQAIFGEYLHHYPYFGYDNKSTIADLNASFAMTKKYYFAEFGENIKATRAKFPALLYAVMYKLKNYI